MMNRCAVYNTILRKLFNEDVVTKMEGNHIWLQVPIGVNTRWIFEMADNLSRFMKVHIKLG